ncbi:hypothetical protein F4809DRAFT_301213 [Biscogniauxia mediterranea]|nr:hypothetical protein F4809DRAFT_301213 [Biscogniauxia mediterranea]
MASTVSALGTLDLAHLRATADIQLDSSLFGRFPSEIREMIYAECWAVSGLEQHIFSRDGRLTHSPCVLAPGEVDTRNGEIHRMCRQSRRRSRSHSLAVDKKWASRFTSTWQEHWRCEEEMLSAQGVQTRRRPRTLFLSMLLACKRTYLEAFYSIYTSVAFVFTNLHTAHHCFVVHPSSWVKLLRSLTFSFAAPYEALHQHRFYSTPPQSPGHWAELSTSLSNLARFDSLQKVAIRLDLSDGRQWSEVRERWILCAIRGILARRLTVQLPEVTHVDGLRCYQYLKGDKTPFRLERYPRLQWTNMEDGRVEPRVEPAHLLPPDRGEPSQTRLRKATRGIRGLVAGIRSI